MELLAENLVSVGGSAKEIQPASRAIADQFRFFRTDSKSLKMLKITVEEMTTEEALERRRFEKA